MISMGWQKKCKGWEKRSWQVSLADIDRSPYIVFNSRHVVLSFDTSDWVGRPQPLPRGIYLLYNSGNPYIHDSWW